MTVELAPDSMGGFDAAAMLRVQDEPEGVEEPKSETVEDGASGLNLEQPPVVNTPGLERVEELDDYELAYADGSTTPLRPVKRHLLRRGPRGGEAHEPDTVIAAAKTDVWAAHRTDRIESDDQPASGHATGALSAHGEQGRRRRPLARIAGGVVAVVVLAGTCIVVSVGGGAGGGSSARTSGVSRTHDDASRTSTTVTKLLTTPTMTASAKRAPRPKVEHKAKPKTHKRPAPHGTDKRTVSGTPAVSSPPADMSTPAVTSTPPSATTTSSFVTKTAAITTTPKLTTTSTTETKTTSTPKSSTPAKKITSSKSHSSSSGSGGLPDLQQTAQQP
jgi:hypothetical protein